MAKTRVCQCPGCGKLYGTRKGKFITCSCGRKFKIDSHIVEVPAAVLKDRPPEKEIKPPEKTGEAEGVAAPFSKDQLLGRRIAMADEKKDKESKEKDTYHCASCNADLVKGQAHCPGCGEKLDWSEV